MNECHHLIKKKGIINYNELHTFFKTRQVFLKCNKGNKWGNIHCRWDDWSTHFRWSLHGSPRLVVPLRIWLVSLASLPWRWFVVMPCALDKRGWIGGWIGGLVGWKVFIYWVPVEFVLSCFLLVSMFGKNKQYILYNYILLSAAASIEILNLSCKTYPPWN